MGARRILVLGATGKQGGALARLLATQGRRVTGLVRSPTSPAARSLAAEGIALALGDLEDAAQLGRAMAGQDACFAVTTRYQDGPDAERRQARAIAAAARASGIAHVVLSSGASADRATGLAHLDGKAVIEATLRDAGVPLTIVAPVSFMENVVTFPWLWAGLKRGELAYPLVPEHRHQYVCCADIAAFAALVLAERAQFLGRRIDIASDAVTGPEAAQVLSTAAGRPIRYRFIPTDEVRRDHPDLAPLYAWYGANPVRVDLAELHRTYPEIGWRRFATWAAQQDWRVLGAATGDPPTVRALVGI